ncbi:MAG TPA: ATP-binding cassette domain-containing protein [Methanocorpusculum sp.]|nr:ATP-binding cassette domain-containing protein [Methanocorpusculum sp.]
MGNPIIEFKNYSYRYPNTDKIVLKNINLTIEEGDFVGIIGCNKAGKSTLCKSMVGILPFVLGGDWDGEVIVDGKNFNETKGEGATSVIGIVFQDAESQFTQETVEDEIAFAMSNFGIERSEMRKRVEYAAKACGLYEMLDRSPFRLSGGQQQRLAIAGILALQPRVLILDESTSQLDPIGRDEVFNLVLQLHAKGSTVIMVDHNIEKIADAANKVLVLHEGEIVKYGEKHEVYADKELLNAHNVRVPQVTDAAIALRSQITGDTLPITLAEAETAFAGMKKGE